MDRKQITEIMASGLHRKRLQKKELADIIGVSPQVISGWVAGKYSPPPEKFIDLVLTLDIVPDLFPGYIKAENQAQNSPSISASLEGGKTDLEGENVPDLEARAEIANLRLNDEKTHEEIAKLKGDFGTMMSDFSSLRMDIEKMMAILEAKKE